MAKITRKWFKIKTISTWHNIYFNVFWVIFPRKFVLSKNPISAAPERNMKTTNQINTHFIKNVNPMCVTLFCNFFWQYRCLSYTSKLCPKLVIISSSGVTLAFEVTLAVFGNFNESGLNIARDFFWWKCESIFPFLYFVEFLQFSKISKVTQVLMTMG